MGHREAADRRGPLAGFRRRFDDKIHMRLGVDPARDGQPDKLEIRPAVFSGFGVASGRVAMGNHADKTRTAFERHIEALPEVTQCYSVSGSWDYELHVLATDMAAYDDFLNRQILNHPSVRAASSSFALRCVKYTTALAVP